METLLSVAGRDWVGVVEGDGRDGECNLRDETNRAAGLHCVTRSITAIKNRIGVCSYLYGPEPVQMRGVVDRPIHVHRRAQPRVVPPAREHGAQRRRTRDCRTRASCSRSLHSVSAVPAIT